jgi:hypothetical protein
MNIQTETHNYKMLIATIFGGWFGLHKYMQGNIRKGLLYTFTLGLFLIGWWVDIFKEYKLCIQLLPEKKKMTNRVTGAGIAALILLFLIGSVANDENPSDKNQPVEPEAQQVVEIATEDITTESTTTEALSTEELTTEKLTTEVSSTQKATTEAPSTQKDATEAPSTQKATTEAPSAKKVTTEAPSTQKATTEAPSTQKVTTEAATTQSPATEAVQNETMVWIPRTGSKYHKNSSCSGMENPTQVTISEAQSLGYQPCKRCY